jgi:anti-sigma factor RsiW
MACVSPPELTDRELLTYIDGEADQQVVAHLERCPHCREKAHRLARLQHRLIAQLYRLTCPSSMELGEYHLGLLSREQAAVVARHLAECPHCTREVAQLKDYLTDVAPTLELGPLERVREQVKVLVARLVSGGPENRPLERPALAPAYASVRGEGEEPYVYQAGDVQIAIDVQDDAERPGRKVILGLVIGTEAGVVKAHLWQADQRVAAVPADELGNFCIPNLASGTYELILSGPDVEIHVPELQVGTR